MSKNLVFVVALVAGALVYPFQSWGAYREPFSGFPSLADKKAYVAHVQHVYPLSRIEDDLRSENPEVRASAVRMLHAYTDTDAEHAFYLALAASIDSKPMVLEQLSYLTRNWGYPRLLPRLLEILEQPDLDSELKRLFLRSLEPYNRDARVLDLLEKTIFSATPDDDPWIARSAAFALYGGDQTRSLDIIERILQGGENLPEEAVAIQALRGRKGLRSDELMRRYSSRPEYGVFLDQDLSKVSPVCHTVLAE